VPAKGGRTDEVGPNPTDRGKPGSKRHLVVDRWGIPLAMWLTAANVNEGPLLEDVIEAIEPIRRPAWTLWSATQATGQAARR
jgi:hypothetical protein